MFNIGDEVVSLYSTQKLTKGQVYKVQAITTKRRLRGQALWLGFDHPTRGKLWHASLSPLDGSLCFRKVIRDEPKAADEEFINLLKKVKA